jgi:RNA polymerase sigma factor (sigma-70 family)
MNLGVRAKIRDGDPEAFGQLFDDCARAVYNHAFRMTGNWAVAEDVMALTFLEAWRLRANVVPDGGPLLPWLLGIATNVARNTSRASRRHAAAIARMPGEGFVPDFADDVVGRLDDVRTLETVRSALSTLRQVEQDVFALVVWAGLDYAAVADALGLPVGTVRSRLSRARRKLRKLIGVSGEPGSGGGQLEGDHDDAARTQEMTT